MNLVWMSIDNRFLLGNEALGTKHPQSLLVLSLEFLVLDLEPDDIKCHSENHGPHESQHNTNLVAHARSRMIRNINSRAAASACHGIWLF